MVNSELMAMLDEDERHWWYRGRRQVLLATTDRLPLPADCAILDAGCGSGRTLEELARYGRVSGVDLSPVAIAAARSRGHGEVREGSVENLPYRDGSFDLITCLDVVEHTPHDIRTLRELRRVSRPGGWLVVTVPAYQWLWSVHDERNGHRRRYNRRTLSGASAAAGWSAVRFTHFNSLLFAPAAVVRLVQRGGTPDGATRSNLSLTPRVLDGLLSLPLRAEAGALRRGASLPAGLSILAVLQNAAPG